MLRRKPTAITITPEDLIAFEEERVRQKTMDGSNAADHSASESAFAGNKYDPNDELKPLPGDKAKIVRTRDERIGVNRRT
ncbi:anaphase-promoting complex, subunit CDC26 [Talaromyces proteolyticus]|uniref:Anaphase-promoting complex, subunit CDC26 n=1 Tax=Talaromyces proteolyticus TaxID=1131652 RepID=A0AAD4PYG2_9EURO|nr:anaphase-promoting complex, subunit CDC26 [Talaromyces proteolyticus]KAH8701150.1 anaphase-promoting complex, subunit CDC26 [Talaromyces proteolyticus]